MALVYHLTTCAHLKRSKTFFDCRCKALEYFAQLLRECPVRLSQDQVKISHKLVMIDDEQCPKYKDMYLESGKREPSRFFKDLNEKMCKTISTNVVK